MSSSRAHFSLFGIPIRVEPFFIIVAVLFGLQYEELDLIIAWVLVTFVSILVHELGHGLVYKAFGERSSIVLHGFGGFTIGTGRVRLGKVQRILVSLSGAIFALVLLWLPLRSLVGSSWFFEQGQFLRALVYFGAFVNLWWSLANLLPIRPLDGGHVAEELIGVERARWLSIIVAVGGGIWAFTQDYEYAGLFGFLLAFMNFMEIRAAQRGGYVDVFDVDAPDSESGSATRSAGKGRRSRLRSVPARQPGAPAAAPPPGGDPELLRALAWSALRDGDVDTARRFVVGLGANADAWLKAAVAINSDLGVELYARAWADKPDGPPSLVATEVLGRSGRAVDVARRLLLRQGASGKQAASTLQTHLHYAECFGPAAEVGEAVFAAGPPSPAQTAFEVACSWARTGDIDRALGWLGRAADAGFRAERVVDGEPDLRPVRADPRWVALRPRLV
jgi:stage IV sporulation protein FB